MGRQWKQWETLFWGTSKSLQMVTAAVKLRHLLLGRKAMTNQDCIKEQKHYFANKGSHNQSYGFSSSHIQIWESDHKEAWVPQRTDAFESWCWGRLFRVPWRARRSNKLILKEINLNIHWKDWCWSSTTLITKCEETTHSKRPWCWDRLRARGEGGDRGWDG